MLICYLLLPPPGTKLSNPLQPVNLNFVYGFSNDAPQAWMPSGLWLLLVMAAMPLILWWPAHLALTRWMPPAQQGSARFSSHQ